MRKLGMVLAVAVLAGLGAGAAQAKLTPAEQKWVTPLIKVWNVQNAGLHLVIGQAAAKNALVAGEKPENYNLTNTLAALINCAAPIKKAGSPPSPRLSVFDEALSSACTHDSAGAHYFAKAIGAVSKKNNKLANSYLGKGVAEFKLGSAQVAKAYKALLAVGGKNIFVA